MFGMDDFVMVQGGKKQIDCTLDRTTRGLDQLLRAFVCASPTRIYNLWSFFSMPDRMESHHKCELQIDLLPDLPGFWQMDLEEDFMSSGLRVNAYSGVGLGPPSVLRVWLLTLIRSCGSFPIDMNRSSRISYGMWSVH